MRNRVISYSFRQFEVFLKVHMIIIIRFGQNVLGPIWIYIYIRVVGEQPFFNTYFIKQNGVFSINKIFVKFFRLPYGIFIVAL